MNKRFHDVPIHTFSFWSNIMVICPKCGHLGIVSFDKEKNIVYFHCQTCYLYEEKKTCGEDIYEVTGQCTSTGRYFKMSMLKQDIHGQKKKVRCPYCDEYVIGDVQLNNNNHIIVYKDIRNASDPYFNYPLYLQTSFRGKTIWALNQEHLQYLIDYLSANLRTVQSDYHEVYKTMRTQSDLLPSFMKLSKNREGIVKALKKLQSKKLQ